MRRQALTGLFAIPQISDARRHSGPGLTPAGRSIVGRQRRAWLTKLPHNRKRLRESSGNDSRGYQLDHAEAFVLDQIPRVKQALLPATLKTAYAAAAAHIADTPMLNVPSVQPGRITQWAVDFGIAKLIESGQWEARHRWSYFEKPTGRYLEVILSHSLLTISQVSDPRKQPRDVLFRANKRLDNRGWLEGFRDPQEAETLGLPHILLVHGHQSLNFAHLGVPNEDHSEGYIWRSPNLMQMPHEVTSPEPPPEETDYEAVMTLKEEIDKWRRDNGD